MVRRFSGRPMWLSMFTFVAALAVAMPALAQSTGMAKGVVKDDRGQPVVDAKVIFEMVGGSGRRYETKSDKKGEFIQIGLQSGAYSVKAEKDKLGSPARNITVRAASTQNVELVLGIASAAAAAEAATKGADLKKAFDEGVAFSTAGKHAEAIEKFNAGIAVSPTCYDCYNNIGYSYSALKEWDKAEAAYKKSTEIKADDATAYNGLATVYNATRKFDLAGEMSAKANALGGAAAGGGGNADALYNQAVILFNQGKPAEAKPLLEQAIAANASHADAHYLLGMSLVGIDPTKAVPEFETYLKLAPTGPADKVKMANDIIAAFKK